MPVTNQLQPNDCMSVAQCLPRASPRAPPASPPATSASPRFPPVSGPPAGGGRGVEPGGDGGPRTGGTEACLLPDYQWRHLYLPLYLQYVSSCQSVAPDPASPGGVTWTTCDSDGFCAVSVDSSGTVTDWGQCDRDKCPLAGRRGWGWWREPNSAF